MSPTPIRIGIVSPVHNRRELTLQCLRSLSRISTEGLEVYTFIADDGSTDGTSEAISREFPKVRVIRGDGDLWFSEGTNVAARAAIEKNVDYVLMMNDDQIFDPDFLVFMVETAEKHGRSIVGPLLMLWDMPHRLFQTSPRWETFSGGWRHWQRQTVATVPEKPWEVDLIVGNCVLIPAEAIRVGGLLNSRHFPNFGDVEYTPRLKKLGFRLIIDPRARVYCQPNYPPKRLVKMTLPEMFNALFVDLKHVQNLRRRFYGYWNGAPNRLLGVLGYAVFLVRFILRTTFENGGRIDGRERPISEMFANRVVE